VRCKNGVQNSIKFIFTKESSRQPSHTRSNDEIAHLNIAAGEKKESVTVRRSYRDVGCN